MGHRQKGKGPKRKRSWHRRGGGPDRAFHRAVTPLERAVRRAEPRTPTDETGDAA